MFYQVIRILEENCIAVTATQIAICVAIMSPLVGGRRRHLCCRRLCDFLRTP